MLKPRKSWSKTMKGGKKSNPFQRSTPATEASFKKEKENARKINQITNDFLLQCIDYILKRITIDELNEYYIKLPYEIAYEVKEYSTLELWARSQRKYHDLYLERRN
jgi:hypothetical protein